MKLLRAYLIIHIVASMTGVYNFVPMLPYGLNVFEYLAVLVLSVTCLLDMKAWKRMRLLIPYGVMIALYYTIALASSPSFGVLWKIGFRHAVILSTLIFAVPAVIVDSVSLRRLAFVVQLAALVCLVVCVAEVHSSRVAMFLSVESKNQGGAMDAAYHAFRPGGLLRNPNEVANFFVVTLLLSNWCSGFLRLPGRVAAIYGTYLSASRGGIILLVSSVVLYVAGAVRYYLPYGRRASWRLIGVALITCSLIFATYWIIGSKVIEIKSDTGMSRYERILSLNYNSGVAGRVALWKVWFPIALESPVYGQGLYSFQGGDYSPASRISGKQGTHNTWIMLLGEIGFLGPLLYFYVVLLCLFRILKIREHPMDRLVLMLLLGVYLAFTVKAHTLLEYPYYSIIMSLLMYLPWFFSNDMGVDSKGVT